MCDARFGAVGEALAENLASRGELGAAVAVIVDGRLVVDLWAGWADAERTRPWREDTVVNVFSAGKALAALCVLRLVDQGRLDLDRPVARCWPEFAAGGKGDVTVRMVLSHRAGLAAIREELPEGALYDRARLVRALAEQEPWWKPGTAHGYHVQTFGLLAGELVRRVGGQPIGAFLRREIAEPLGADVSFGLEGRHRHRRADYVFSRETLARPSGELGEMRMLAYLNPPLATGLGTVNTVAWQEAELPSSNAHATARGLAGVYAALIGGDDPAILGRETLEHATEEASAGIDLVLDRPSRFGLGFQLTQPERQLGPNPRGFGHFGVGGSVGFADPDAGVAFAYTMNRGGPRWQNPRNRALIDALFEAL